ncbi:MAG: DUF2357 domain-containing protein, partial [Hyphomicrobiaceae bacterium]|nr:DUF2357 domain-containing protein [Hyphomicrobiaceae bacterium]
MTNAFHYRARRQGAEFQRVAAGSTLSLSEQTDYVLLFEREPTAGVVARVIELGGEFIDPNTVLIRFSNFIGSAELAGVLLDVVSTKIDAQGISKLLDEVSNVSSRLAFGWGSPTRFLAGRLPTSANPIPYHQLQFLRRKMLQEPPGRRLQDWLATIARNPTRRFASERPVVTPDRIRRLDHRSVSTIFARLDRLVPVPATSPIYDNPLAIALTFGESLSRHFPRTIAASKGRLSFDTPENRFAKRVVSECLGLLYRFADHPRLHRSFKSDCRKMLTELEAVISFPAFAECAPKPRMDSPTQALTKGEGYRDVFSFWFDFMGHFSLPASPSDVSHFLEGKNIATLYEYWVFVRVLEAIEDAHGSSLTDRSAMISRDSLGESISLGFSIDGQEKIRLRYNCSYTRSNGGAYSTPLRPDVVLEFGQSRYCFDAKYRLDRLEISEDDADEGIATYKRADLYKMHTYRDAIDRMKAAFVVYPGTQFVFFSRDRSKAESVSLLST